MKKTFGGSSVSVGLASSNGGLDDHFLGHLRSDQIISWKNEPDQINFQNTCNILILNLSNFYGIFIYHKNHQKNEPDHDQFFGEKMSQIPIKEWSRSMIWSARRALIIVEKK